jgi:hypothetical protein
MVAIVKNEAQYIQEWLYFHSMLGVKHFYIYDNNSSDSTAELLRRYNSVTTIAWPQEEAKTQRVAYAHALTTFGSESRWMVFIDADEFVFPTRYDTLPEALSKYEDLPGLVVPWRMFGHSGHRTRPAGLVIENYTKTVQLPHPQISQRDYGFLRKVKSIVDPTRVKGVNPHVFLTDGGVFHTPNRQLWSKDHPCSPAEDDHILLNHYFSKSEEEFEAKVDRGFIDMVGPSHAKYAESASHAKYAERKRVMAKAIESAPIEDRKIQRFVPILRARMGLLPCPSDPVNAVSDVVKDGFAAEQS